MNFNQLEFLLSICKNNTPVFNEAIFRSFDSKGYYFLDFDNKYLIRNLETILYKNTPVKILEEKKIMHMTFYKIECSDYPSKLDLFVHKQNIGLGKKYIRVLPSIKQIQTKLKALKHMPYFWGGTLPHPLENADQIFKHQSALTPFEKKCISFEGLDCSGLLYHVTNGYTPRNTSSLMNFGKVTKKLKPLDIILWPGHCILVRNEKQTIESREYDGLVTESLEKRLQEIKAKRKWVEKIDPESTDKFVYTTRRFLFD